MEKFLLTEEQAELVEQENAAEKLYRIYAISVFIK